MTKANYKGKTVGIKLRSAGNPYTDEWNVYFGNVPSLSIDMPKGWQPSKTVRVNGILGV